MTTDQKCFVNDPHGVPCRWSREALKNMMNVQAWKNIILAICGLGGIATLIMSLIVYIYVDSKTTADKNFSITFQKLDKLSELVVEVQHLKKDVSDLKGIVNGKR